MGDAESEETTLVLAHWDFVGTGLNPTEQWLSASLAELTPAVAITEGETSND